MGPVLQPEFKVSIQPDTLSYKIESALLSSTAEMNNSPLKVNQMTWRTNTKAMQATVNELTAKCQEIAGWPGFRPNASKDCQQVFLEKRALPVLRKTPSGTPAMDIDTLTVFDSMGDNLAGTVIKAREAMSKLSQLNAWEKYALAGQVQCKWNQLGTPMGRYSCEDPNLQNRITEIRETIEAPEGSKLLSLDLGQAEYVVWASLSKDPLLTSIFQHGLDLHTVMINNILEVFPGLNLQGQEPRKIGKTINFALLYLMKPWALCQKLGCTGEEATKIIEAYKQRAPTAVQYIQDCLAQFQKQGWTSTYFGRHREMSPGFKVPEHVKHEINKTAWHHHNAGTAAEILKVKQAKLHKQLRAQFSTEQVRLSLQMHDELIYTVRDDVLEEVKQITMAEFTRPIEGFLNFRIDQRVGQNWLQTSK